MSLEYFWEEFGNIILDVYSYNLEHQEHNLNVLGYAKAFETASNLGNSHWMYIYLPS